MDVPLSAPNGPAEITWFASGEECGGITLMLSLGPAEGEASDLARECPFQVAQPTYKII